MTVDEYFREEQKKRIRNYQDLNELAQKGQILFTGSSLMEQFPINEISADHGLGKVVYNRGVGGYTTDDFLREIDTMLLNLEPSVVFINIGTNDINARFGESEWLEHLIGNYDRILSILKRKLPDTRVYVMRYYPVNVQAGKSRGIDLGIRANENVNRANEQVKVLAEKYGFTYIDVNEGLTDAEGNLQEAYTVDGIHMYPKAYEIVYQNLLSYL